MPDKSNSCNFQVMAAEWPCLPGFDEMVTSGFSMGWASQNLSRSWVSFPAWPSHPSPGQLLLGTRACWGIFLQVFQVIVQEKSCLGPPWNLVEILFFSVICFWACSHSRRAATSLVLLDDKQSTYSDLLHMLLLFSSPNLKSDSSFEENVFWFCQVLSLTCLSKQFSQG